MSEAPADLRYTENHEWVRVEDDVATIGITAFAQNELGEVVYVELPEVGETFEAGDAFGSIESVKAAEDVFTPVGGEVVEVNEDLADAPEKVNEEPYGDGWLLRVKMSDVSEVDGLLDAEKYGELVSADD